MLGNAVFGDRLRSLNSMNIKSGSYVLYWMQASQRTEYNHALEYAVAQSNKLGKPLLVFFGITNDFPEANERHYRFMLEGIREVKSSLRRRGIEMTIWQKSPELGAVELSKEAALVVTDRGYLRIERSWRSHVAQRIDSPLIQVESNVVVPVETASSKEEYSAATLRPKIGRCLWRFLIPLGKIRPKMQSLGIHPESFNVDDVEKALSRLDIDRNVKPAIAFRGGSQEAKRHLDTFLKRRLNEYVKLKNDPTQDVLSNMSPYLHFGQISPLYIALRVLNRDCSGKEAFLEELVVRRELSMNLAHYNQNYDNFECLPSWAKETLTQHQRDKRDHIYSCDELEKAETHDPCWNAAQHQMLVTGKMHGYMRMYWGKKILEWTKSPQEAYSIALCLNNKYELDGRDPNGFAGVAWCFGKHDRPWAERTIFGKIRYMNAKGLDRKFDVPTYIEKIKALTS